MVKVKGLEFDECFRNAKIFEDDGLSIRTIDKNDLNDLIMAKTAAGRPKDLDDLENL